METQEFEDVDPETRAIAQNILHKLNFACAVC